MRNIFALSDLKCFSKVTFERHVVRFNCRLIIAIHTYYIKIYKFFHCSVQGKAITTFHVWGSNNYQRIKSGKSPWPGQTHVDFYEQNPTHFFKP